MRINLTDTPRLIATNGFPPWIHFRVISGTCLISPDSQNLLSGGGLPLSANDNIVSLNWTHKQLWLQATSAVCELEAIV
jgi:hypothetical protein